MVASTTSANPTITGECVAELECGFSREAPKNCLHDGLRKSDLTSVSTCCVFFSVHITCTSTNYASTG